MQCLLREASHIERTVTVVVDSVLIFLVITPILHKFICKIPDTITLYILY